MLTAARVKMVGSYKGLRIYQRKPVQFTKESLELYTSEDIRLPESRKDLSTKSTLRHSAVGSLRLGG